MLNREHLDSALREIEENRRRAEALADLHTEEAEKADPRLKELGLRLRSTAARVLEESMKGGADLAQRLERIRRESLDCQEEYRQRLVALGHPADYTKPRRECPICGDTGYFEGKICACLKRRAVMEGYRASGIGRLLQKQRFDNFDLSYYSDTLLPEKRYSPRDVMRSLLSELKEYAENFSMESPSLLFIGGTGLGKTHLSSAIAGKVIEKGFEVVYESAPQVCAVFERERFESAENAVGTRRLFEAELLILDDLGTEPPSKSASSAIYHLINHRVLSCGRPTVISTNLTSRALEKQYDSAVLSRLLGEFEVKLFQGEDVRLAKLK
ncbi:MAG: ATP-binding protein [Clostridia bacterium]|nr:ATP-binding protein [Clostridia bacterium]